MWKVISSEIVHRTPWLEVVRERCSVKGEEVEYTYVKKVDEGPVIVPVSDEGCLWMVRQYRHPIRRRIWQFPVEGKDVHEEWEAAARRGLEEELQQRAERLELIGEVYVDPGGSTQKTRVYVASGLSMARAIKEETEEVLERRKFTLDEVERLIDEGEVVDNWTLAVMYLYQRYLRTKR